MTADEVKAVTTKFKAMWKEAAIWALAAAFLLELGINVAARRTVWHRVDAVEEKVKSLEHTRELEELQTRQQLNELRQKSNENKAGLDQVEKEVRKK
jgi:hypothetical protein